jgi:hypothetical protein
MPAFLLMILGENHMVLMLMEKEVNAVKEYLKQIEIETMAMADRLKLDSQTRWGIEDKFRHAYAALEIKAEPEPPRVAKIDARAGIKRVM